MALGAVSGFGRPGATDMSADPGSLDDTCPRCRQAFHCGVADAAPCPCTDLALAPGLAAALRSQFDGCLCRACLTCLSELAVAQPRAVMDEARSLAGALPPAHPAD